MTDLADDLEATVAAACAALRTAVRLDWDGPATGLTWSVRSTVEHVADDLFAYAGQIATATPELAEYVPFTCSADRPGEAQVTTHARREAGNDGGVRVLDACGGMLVSLARTRTSYDGCWSGSSPTSRPTTRGRRCSPRRGAPAATAPSGAGTARSAAEPTGSSTGPTTQPPTRHLLGGLTGVSLSS